MLIESAHLTEAASGPGTTPISEGMWNLKVNPLVRTLFFNYHHQLAHHQAA